jgi:hypothetical protein
MQILGTISECLISILRNVRANLFHQPLSACLIHKQVAADEDALDQQLISSGLNDRNIEAYLGIIEQRLDYLIQVSLPLFLSLSLC